jgi:predicted nucleic acid-binding protein
MVKAADLTGTTYMKERSFIDTNILVYSDDADATEKCASSVSLLETAMRTRFGVISTQVLQEYFVASTRKLGVNPSIAKTRVQFFAKLDVVQISADDVLSAIDLHRLHSLSFWDSLILHAAKKAGCSVLLTEDMNHGQKIEGIRIHNPFL